MLALAPWASGVGRVICRAVQLTLRADGVPPVTLLTVIGVVGQLPCALSQSRR